MVRADWRFLLAWTEARAPVIRLASARRARWMEDDGWAVAEGPADVVAVDDGPELARVLAGEQPDRLIVWHRGRGLRRRPSTTIPDHYRQRTYLPIPMGSEPGSAGDGPRAYLPLDPDGGPVLREWIEQRLPWPVPGLAWVGAAVLGRVGRGRGVVVVAVAETANGGSEETEGQVPTFVVTSSGHDEGSRAVRISRWTTSSGRPRSVVEKFVNRPHYDDNTEREQEALASVRSRLPEPLRAAVPEPLGLDTRAGVRRATESFIAGPTMAQALGPRRSRASGRQALDQALAWFDAVAEVTAEPFHWSDEHTRRWLLAPLADLPGELCRSSRLHSLVESVAGRAEGARAATVLRHYDPGPWNLVLGPQLGVVDWELRPPRPADRTGLALCDHLYLVWYWRHVVVGSRASTDEWAVSGLGEPATGRRRWAIETGRDLVLASAAAHGIDQRVLPALWVHNWLEQAVFTSLRRPDGSAGSGVDYLRWAGDGTSLLRHWSLN